jgi:hypothetical protein
MSSFIAEVAGLPAIKVFAGQLLVTTARKATTDLSPISQPFKTAD